MIQTLQKKVVVTAMAAVTVLLLFLLGAINVANMLIVERQVDRTLRIISDSEAGGIPPRSDGAPPFMEAPKNDYDTFLSSNFFVVRFDWVGNILNADIQRTSSVTEEEAREMAAQAYDSGQDSGRTGKFRYLFHKTPVGSAVVFLDTSGERLSLVRILLLSVALGAACWGAMLLLVMFLSRRAVRPVAESMEKQKQFVTNAGHEIKTPLAIIQSNTEAMELYNGENKWSRNIKEQTVRLSGLMQNLLLLARMDEGASQVQAADFSLSDMLTAALESFAQPMEAKHISLEADVKPGVTLHADAGQVEQLLSILLDNAVKYTNEGGAIWIRLQKEDKKIRLSVQNTCETLPDTPPEKLFDRFYRGDTARTQRSGGYGIGLAVARSIAEANRGTLQADYLPPDRICFTAQF